MVFDGGFADHEHAASLLAQGLLADAQRTQPFGAGPLEELEVVGVEDDAAGIFVPA